LVQLKRFRLIALIAYLLIILKGWFIGAPFFAWLLFTLFDFGNIDQLFAALAIVGLIIVITNSNKKRTLKILLLDILSFLLLALPILARLAVVPIEQFNYLAFILPTEFFVMFYLISLGFSFGQYLEHKRNINP
jgi:hypothetical protein